MYPDAASLIKEIVLMGGAIGLGNTRYRHTRFIALSLAYWSVKICFESFVLRNRPAAEFNIEVDPEAAKVPKIFMEFGK